MIQCDCEVTFLCATRKIVKESGMNKVDSSNSAIHAIRGTCATLSQAFLFDMDNRTDSIFQVNIPPHMYLRGLRFTEGDQEAINLELTAIDDRYQNGIRSVFARSG